MEFVTEMHPFILMVSTTLSFNARWVLVIHVQFSVFKSIVFVFPITNLLTFNIVVLILGPIILVLLVIWKRIIIARQREIGGLPRSRAPHFRYFSLNPQSSDSRRRDYNGVSSVPQSRTDRLIAIWAHSKFWIALLVTSGLEALLVFLYTVINPFVSPKLLSIPSFQLNVFDTFRQYIHIHTSFCSPSCPLLISHSISCSTSQPHCHSTHQNLSLWHPLKINTSLSFTYICSPGYFLYSVRLGSLL